MDILRDKVQASRRRNSWKEEDFNGKTLSKEEEWLNFAVGNIEYRLNKRIIAKKLIATASETAIVIFKIPCLIKYINKEGKDG